MIPSGAIENQSGKDDITLSANALADQEIGPTKQLPCSPPLLFVALRMLRRPVALADIGDAPDRAGDFALNVMRVLA
jgi:hypothetical protein